MSTSRAWQFNRFSWKLPDVPDTQLAFYAGAHYGIRLMADDAINAEKAIDDLQALGRAALERREESERLAFKEVAE